MSEYHQGGQGSQPPGPPIPPIDSTEWRRLTAQYRRPGGTIVLSFRQLTSAFNALRAHIEGNPAFYVPRTTHGAIIVRNELEALGQQIDMLTGSRSSRSRRILNQRFSRALNIIAASYTNLRELVDLRRQFIRVLDLYNANSAGAEQALRAHVHGQEAEERRRNSENDARQRQISAIAAYVPVGVYTPPVYAYDSPAQSSTGSNVVGYTSPSASAVFYANQSTYNLQGAPSLHSDESISMNSGVLLQQPGQYSEDAVAALGEARLLAEETRLAAAQRHGGQSRPSGNSQPRPPHGGHGGQGTSHGYETAGSQAYPYR